MTVGEPGGDAEGSYCFGYRVKDFPLWDPNRRAQERERAAAELAAKTKRAEAERKAIAEAERIVVIWNARLAGGLCAGMNGSRISTGLRALCLIN